MGSRLDLVSLGLPHLDRRPVHLHFFNPSCPCSNFGIEHLKWLSIQHSKNVHFIAVLQGESSDLTARFRSLGLEMDSVEDRDGRISRATGIYSTPQAVIVDSSGSIYYRGNYNSSRYCTNPQTEFARIALQSLLSGKPAPPVPSMASVAYGCPLPPRSKGKNPT